MGSFKSAEKSERRGGLLGKIDTPLDKKLQAVKWGKFRLGDLFEKIKVNSLKYKTNDLPNIAQEEYDLPALTAGIQNQGLNNYVPRKNATVLKNVISISANGANTGATFYQSKEFTVLQDAYAIRWIYSDKILTDDQSLFLVSAISKRIYGSYEWTNKAGWERIKNDSIKLPITSSGEIDFDFMESFISELKEERMRKLAAYLQATGLKDYELTTAEQQALNAFEHLEWGEYKIGDLFEKLNLSFNKSKFNKNTDISKSPNAEFSLPLVNAKDGNNGIMYYGRPEDFESAKMTIDIINDGAISAGNVYSQPQETGVLYNAYLIKPKFYISTNLLHFFTVAIRKSIKMKFSYELKATWERVKKETIYLPTNNGTPDYAAMETFISAVQKLVIKDVVQYADKRIAATAKLVK